MPLLTWPGRKLSTKANRAQLADFGGTLGFASTVSPHYQDFHSYLQAYKQVPFVAKCVGVIAYNAANVAYRLVPAANDEDDMHGEVTDSPLLALLAKPNPYQTGFELREMMFMDLELTGNCFIALEAQDGRGLPSELYRLQPDHVTIKGDPRAGIASYVYTANGKPIYYQPDEIWHQRLPHPFDPLYGMGTVETMETRADAARAMAEHEAKFWQSGAKITGVLSTAENLEQTVWDRLKSNFRQFLKDSGFSTLILEHGLTYAPVSQGLGQLGLREMSQMSRDEILTMFGVPPTKVGIIESANYKAEAADQYFWASVIDPKLTRNEQAMQSLVDLFHPGQNLVLRYERLDFSDDSEQARVAEIMSRTLTFTINELREYQGKEPVKAGDVILIGNRPPVAFDPDTGEATVLGGATPGVLQVDENGMPVPILLAAPRPVAGAPAIPASAPGDAAPPRAVAGKAAANLTRLRSHKREAERIASGTHTAALVQAFYEQEQAVKHKLAGVEGGLEAE